MISIHDVTQAVLAVYHLVAPFVPLAVIGGVIATFTVQAAKKWIIDPKHKKTIKIFNGIVSGIIIVVHTIMQAAPTNKQVVAFQLLLVAVSSSKIYEFVLKPILDTVQITVKTSNTNPQLPTTTHTFEA